jgi:hypothetical protein
MYGKQCLTFSSQHISVLEYFSNVQRAPVVALEYQSVAIECSPPPYKPGKQTC